MKNEHILLELKNSISSGKWKPGDKIPSETELAVTFAVSRNTMRGLIQRLIAMGALIVVRGEGTFVNDKNVYDYILNSFIPIIALEDNEMIDMMEFRKYVVIEYTQLVALNHDENDLANMFECLMLMRKHMNDLQEYVTAYYNLHVCIAAATKNILIREMIVKMKDFFYAEASRSFDFLNLNDEVEGYEKYFAAIIRRDYIIAQQCIRVLVEKNIANIKEKVNQIDGSNFNRMQKL